ncbi:beta-galactosidase [Arthrobacter sp. Sr24]
MLHVSLQPPEPPLAGHLRMGTGSPNPGGKKQDVALAGGIHTNSQHLVKYGKAWFPIMGEYHYGRQDRAHWKSGLERMKQGGITVVSTYVFWHHHEERRGQFHWSGNRNLRAFVELCEELDLDAVVRIGPWVHGEARNGGFPDWLQELPIEHRSNDPEYLMHVKPFFAEIAHQLRGLYSGHGNSTDRNSGDKDTGENGGPIVAIQLENELYDQPEHILTLKQMATSLGMTPPLWTATAWGGDQLPAGEVLPLYGGYPEAFWEDAHPGWARGSRKHYFFSNIRDDHSIGADLRSTAASDEDSDDALYPYATCELGGGMPSAYHRRPIIPAQDVAALALSKIGSGSTWQGYFMYHGATQGMGQDSTLQESQATGYPNDLPVMSYDFQAPLGEYTQVRESYHRLRAQHLFLAEAGEQLATMPMTLPASVPEGLDDTHTVRWAVRSDGHSGFIFVNNYQPSTDALPAHDGVQFSLTLANDEHLVVPSQPMNLPAGAHFIWPFNLPLGGGVTLLSATAQLITSLPTEAGICHVFSRTSGIAAEFVVQLPADDGGPHRTLRPHVPLGSAHVLLQLTDGVSVLLVDEAAALRLWKVEFAGRERIVLADSLVVSDRELLLDAAPEQVVGFFPPLEQLRVTAEAPLLTARIDRAPNRGPFSTFSVTVPAAPLETALDVRLEKAAAGPAPIRAGGLHQRASAPVDTDYINAAHFHIKFTPEELATGPDNLLRIDWTGDCARAYVNGQLISDNYWNGLPWDIDLSAHREDLLRHGLSIQAFPFNPEAAIYVEESIRPRTTTLEIHTARILHRQKIQLSAG